MSTPSSLLRVDPESLEGSNGKGGARSSGKPPYTAYAPVNRTIRPWGG